MVVFKKTSLTVIFNDDGFIHADTTGRFLMTSLSCINMNVSLMVSFNCVNMGLFSLRF